MRLFIYSLSMLFLISYSESTFAQAQTIIEKDSDSSNPQLLILEKETGTGSDGWARLWFQHDDELSNKWAISVRPKTGATTGDGLLNQPFVFAFNSAAKLTLSSDGELRLNNNYTFPGVDGSADQVLLTDGNGLLSWSDLPDTYWESVTDGISYQGLVTINPTDPSTFDEAAHSVLVNRANGEPMLSYRNTNALGDAAVFMNASAKYWAYGIDSDINAFKINHLGNGINTTLDDGNQRFTILGDNGNVGLGTEAPDVALELANSGADIRFTNSDASAIQWYESGTEVAFLGHNNNNLVLKNDETLGNIIVDANDDIFLRHDGVNQLVISDTGEVSIEDVLRLKPRAVAPTCANGRLYYDSTDNKVYACSAGTWKALMFE